MFCDIEKYKVDSQGDTLINYYNQIANANEGILQMQKVHLPDVIAGLSLISDEQNMRDAFNCLHLQLMVLFRYNK